MSLLVVSLATQASAALVYEGFDFTGDVVGPGSGNGWGGDWNGSNNNAAGKPEAGTGLTLGSLPVTGGSYSRPARFGVAQSNRLISAGSQATLTGDGSTMWFSVLMNATSGGTNSGYALNSHGAIIFGDTAFGLGDPATAPITNAGNALGVSFDGIDGDFNNVAVRGLTYLGGSQAWDTNAITVGANTVMIVGKIDWAANGTDDVLNLYNITDPTAPLPTAFTTMTADWDQSTFNMVAIGQGQTEVFDEIRFDTTLAGVGVVPEPSSAALLGLGGVALLLRRRK